MADILCEKVIQVKLKHILKTELEYLFEFKRDHFQVHVLKPEKLWQKTRCLNQVLLYQICIFSFTSTADFVE